MKLSVIVPCYNEEEVLPRTISELSLLREECIRLYNLTSCEIIFVDDGSEDKTWEIITTASTSFLNEIRGVRLSRNRGHQNALLAGMDVACGDYLITIDADLQDDISAVKKMIHYAQQGFDIILGVRKERTTDSFFKRSTAEFFYKTMRLCGVELVFNHADFRCMSKRAVAALAEFKEVNLFLRGIIPQLGFNTALVYYDRKERLAGTTKYPLRKMLSFAWQGITSFSTLPLRVISLVGCSLACLSIVVGLWAVYLRLSGKALPGWTSTIVPITFLSGVQLFSLGIIGEYIGKIYFEIKHRPRYFIKDVTEDSSGASRGADEHR